MKGHVEETVLRKDLNIKVVYREPRGEKRPYYQAIGLGEYNDLEYKGQQEREAVEGLKSKIAGRMRASQGK